MISRNFLELPYKSKEEIYDLQNHLLRKQLNRLSLYSSYYQKLFKSLKIKPDKILTLDDLQEIPLLDKKDYMEDPDRFCLNFSAEAPVQMHEKILWNVHYTTGTTTGRP